MAFENYEFDMEENVATIKVIGVGGAGGNAVNRMIETKTQGVDFIAANTDAMALRKNNAPKKILLGEKITHGRGAGANPEVGKSAADETLEDIRAELTGADMLFITAGMGGGTGTGAAPVIAKLARDMGILTVGIVTKPFAFEGKVKMQNALKGIENLREYVDSLIVIPNEKLKFVTEQKITLLNAFATADDVLRQGVQSISELINVPGLINLDFNDVTTVMANAGLAHMGIGRAKGKDKAETASRAAISSPLLETAITGAKGLIINFTVSPDIGLDDIYATAEIIAGEANTDATIIWGVSFDESFDDEMKVTVIATGFDADKGDATPIAQNQNPGNPIPNPQPKNDADKPKDNNDWDFNDLFNANK